MDKFKKIQRKVETREMQEKWGKAPKPVETPAKRFVELPGGLIKRKTGKIGGPLAEKGKHKGLGGDITHEESISLRDKGVVSKFPRKSSGHHEANVSDRPMFEQTTAEKKSKNKVYVKAREEFNKKRSQEDSDDLALDKMLESLKEDK